MITFTYQWERDDGNIAGASGTANVAEPGQISESYTPISGDIGHTIRLRASDGVTTYYSSWQTITAAPSPSAAEWFGSGSVWNTPIGASPTVLGGSSGWIAPFVGTPINYNRGAYTTSKWTVTGATPTLLWKLIDAWLVDNVPTPSGLVSTQDPPGATEWYAIFDYAADNKLWSSLVHTYGYAVAGYWGAYNMFPYRRDGSGICQYSDYGAGRACGSCQGAGMITRAEIAAGVIPHALGIALNNVGSTYVAPFRHTDGSGGSSAIPMGSRIQYDPTINVAASSYSSFTKIVLKALQDYGMYVVDSSSNPSFYCQQYNIGDGAGSLGPFTDSQMPADVWPHMRVVQNNVTSVTLDSLSTFSQPHH